MTSFHKVAVVALLALVSQISAGPVACPSVCPQLWDPVCGSDGTTYASECAFNLVSCRLKLAEPMTISYKGSCKEVIEPEVQCNRVCPKMYDPVCGTDGQTYNTQCDLEVSNCLTKALVKVASIGACDTAIEVPECPQICPMIYAPVCGSDGKTYDNKCNFEAFRCQKKDRQLLTIVKMAACDAEIEVPECPQICPMIYAPVCGSDGKTYDNKCNFEAFRCQKKDRQLLTIVKMAACDAEIDPEPNMCSRACPRNYDPVCGTDGKTYNTLCDLEVASCLSKGLDILKVAFAGACDTAIEVPECPQICPMIYAPVCGSDGKTYDNKCNFEAFRCQKKDRQLLTIVKMAACDAEIEVPECPQICPMIYAPVCGSDGKTYDNKCNFEAFRCQKKDRQLLTIVKMAACDVEIDPEPQCNRVCPKMYDPVCGTDGKTYNTQCDLEVASCLSKGLDSLKVAFIGACDTAIEVPECPQLCPMIYAPVCGSDGKTYDNKCNFQAMNCKRKDRQLITIIKMAACDAEIDPEPNMCNRACPRNYDPVCGTDGKTYNTLCDLEVASCLSKGLDTLKVAFAGACDTAIEVPDECPQICPLIYAPVCGSDGKTYDNKCNFQAFNCKRKDRQLITIVKMAACDAEIEPEPTCNRVCPKMYDPVCGTDGKTYNTQCDLEVASCLTKGLIAVQVAHAGACDTAIEVPECPQICPMIYAPVCGSDGKTYDNKCNFEAFRCQKKDRQLLTIVKMAACDAEIEVPECPQICPMIYAPVCGSDGKTYDNKCNFEAFRCQKKDRQLLTIVKMAACDAEIDPEPNMCSRACPKMYDPVCGTDGKTYNTLCDLEVASCLSKGLDTLKVAFAGACDTAIEVPECPQICPLIYAPVCGSDGKTYDNKCNFEAFRCQKKDRQLLTIVKMAACDAEIEVPECPQICPMIYAPVCGSDGKTYDNKCNFEAFRCQKKDRQLLSIVKMEACDAVVEEIPTQCKMVCPKDYSPVCGTDGQTYNTQCDMEVANCLSKSLDKVKVAFAGTCMAECSFGCPQIWEPVCGNDKKTYANDCFLDTYNCQQRELGAKLVRIARRGEC